MSLKRRRENDGALLKSDQADSSDENAHTKTNGNSALRQTKRPKRSSGSNVAQNGSFGGVYTEEVYKSNLFKLQVDELLEQVKPNFQTVEAKLNDLLRSLKSLIENIPNREPASISEAEKQCRLSHVMLPISDSKPNLDANYRISFEKASSMNVVGSYALKTLIREDTQRLDFIVTMPSSLFLEKDYLNHRYFLKRAYYLACLAHGIKKNGSQMFKIQFDLLNGNQLLPILILQPLGSDLLKTWQIQVIPAVQEDTFKKERLHPSRNCVRDTTKDSGSQDRHPTSFYNGSILNDSLITSYLKIQHGAIKSSDSFLDASILGRVWLQQRGFSSSCEKGGFGSFEWNLIMGLLLKGGGSNDTPLFSQGYTSYQLFKAMLQFLVSKDLTKIPLAINYSGQFPPPKNSGVPFLLDGQNVHNVLYKMTPWSYKLLRHDAKVTLDALSDQSFDQFHATFIAKVDHPLYRFDSIIEIPERILSNGDAEAEHVRISELYKVLTKALNNRVDIISIQRPSAIAWDISKKLSINSENTVLIGFIFNEAHINRIVDRGPSAEQAKEAAAFRKFWGDKAELRRFKDGSIIESIVWTAGSTSIFQCIISYVLAKHFGADLEQSVNFIDNSTTRWLPTKLSRFKTNQEAFQEAVSMFQSLEQVVRGLDDMPLHLRQMLPADSQLSHTSVRLPFVGPLGQGSAPANLTIQFEGSARWPDDMAAVQRTKVAFLIKLAELLEQSNQDLTCKIGLENDDANLQNQAILDITNTSGSVFRLRIHHDREATLLERLLKDKTRTPTEKLNAASALHTYKQTFIGRPAHTQAIQILSIRYPSFSEAVRLVKLWFDSHLLSSYFHECLIELFVAQVYTRPYPWSAPASGICALLRTLHMLGQWDWRNEPWITNLGHESMSELELSAINTRFQAWRKIDPAFNRVVIFAASNVDGEGTTWTDNAQPPKVVAGRMTSLARLSVQMMKDKGSQFDVGGIFTSSLTDYDFTINLDRDVADGLSWRSNVQKRKFKNLQLQNATDIETIGYDPVQLLVSELQETFRDSVVLFYNSDKRDVIAGLWAPQTRRSWKLKLGYSSIPVGKNDECDLNKDAILNEIARIAGNLVSRISVKKI
jgi:U3 small nucleolar RNA-associated protein 22